MRKMNRKGAEKYYVVISIILGLAILVIVLFWIFQEYFGQDEINKETCRQSIILRNTLPELKKGGIEWVSLKDKYPLKCKTDVVNINYKNVSRSEREIADKLVECWYLFGNGEFTIASSKTAWGKSICIFCSRISVDSSVRDFYVNNYADKSGKTNDNRIDILRALNTKFAGGKTYKEYLNSFNFPAFNPAGGREFNHGQPRFWVAEEDSIEGVLNNPKTGKTETGASFRRVDLPQYFNPEQSLLIAQGFAISSSSSGIGDYIPYLFYLHTNEIGKLDEKNFIDGSWWENYNLCENNEGIPA